MSVEKRRIRQVIVVEGHHDTEKLRKYFDCDTIETSGTHLGKKVIEEIREAQKRRGVIIFTDPDSPGNRIRNAINQAVPNCGNAFVMKKDAHTTKKVGVEHAEKDVLEAALDNVVTYEENKVPEITVNDLVELGLTGTADSAARREKVGEILHIGMGNAKTMLRRINFLGITKEELREAISQ